MISECSISKYNNTYKLFVNNDSHTIEEELALKLINYGIPCKDMGINYIVEVTAEPLAPSVFYFDVMGFSKDNASDIALDEFKDRYGDTYMYKYNKVYTYNEFKNRKGDK